MFVHARSLVRRLLTHTGFWRRISLMTLANGLTQCLRRKSSPRVSESVQNWSLWTEKCPRPWWWHFLLCDLGFYGSFLKPTHGYIEGISVKRSVRQSVSQTRLLRPLHHLFTYFWGFTVEGPHFELFLMWKCDVKLSITMCRVLYYLLYYFSKHSIEVSS